MGSASGVFKVAKIDSASKSASAQLMTASSDITALPARFPLLYVALAASMCVAIAGCSGNGSWMGSTATPASSISSGEELARRSLFSPSQSNSQSDFAVQLVERENTSEIEIAMPANSMSKPQITALDSPSRVVIDLEGVHGPKSSTIETPESLYVSRVRIGAHPDKSRIVLDMNEGQEIVPTLQESGNGNYKIQLSKAEGSAEIVALADTKAIEPAATELASAEVSESTPVKVSQTAKSMEFDSQGTPSVVERAVVERAVVEQAAVEQALVEPESSYEKVALNSVNEKETTKAPKFSEPKGDMMASPALDTESLNETPSLNEAPAMPEVSKKKTTLKPNKVDLPTVYSYELQSVSPSENSLVIDGDQLSHYTMKRTAPSEYVLRLPGATLAAGAQETIVAPQGTGAIRSVRAKVAGDVLEVRIFTAPQENLEVKGSKNNLVVASSSGFDLSKSLAQAKPELASGKELALNASANEANSGATPSVDNEISALLGDKPRYTGRLISLDLQDTDIDNALRIIAEVSNLNIIASEEVTGKITLRLIDVPWDQALDVILKTNGLDSVQENNVVRIAPVEKLRAEREALKQSRQAEEELEPLSVRYVRISYAKVAELKPLVESVLSERGIVAYDDRTNQLIVKDVRKGIVNVAELIAKLDLRTPQVLLETQIVEATRFLSRDLGSEFGFNYVRSPATGNATGNNFPNSIAIGGSNPDGKASSFPGDDSSAVTFLLQSADGTKSLSARLTALEREGRVKIVSRPAVATTNNKQAIIKSVEKVRVKQPSGGTSVATGQGATASGSGTATEEFDVGIVLEVTPQASPDYYVLLDINAKSSSLGANEVDGIPTEIERSATSSVLVSSGQTFAMGGIYKTTEKDGVEGVPFLKDIPVIGYLFRRQLVEDQDEELLFFITPRIIEGSFDDAAMKST